MKTLFNALSELTSSWNDGKIVPRSTGGYIVCFEHLIPHFYLMKLIAFCTLYNYTYYISVENNLLQFEILR